MKSFMFETADKILKGRTDINNVIILGDIVDRGEKSVKAYKVVLKKAVHFAKKHPNAYWIYGNHDLSYLYQECEDCSEHYDAATQTVREYFDKLSAVLNNKISYIKIIDDFIFSHAGLCDLFVESAFNQKLNGQNVDLTALENKINASSPLLMSTQASTIWYRPNDMFLPFTQDKCFQVVGHSPVKKITQWYNMILTDVFTVEESEPGLIIVDTKSKEIELIDKFGKMES